MSFGHVGKVRVVPIGYMIILSIIYSVILLSRNKIYNGSWLPNRMSFFSIYEGIGVTGSSLSEAEILEIFPFATNNHVEIVYEAMEEIQSAPAFIPWILYAQGCTVLLFSISATLSLFTYATSEYAAFAMVLSVFANIFCEVLKFYAGCYCVLTDRFLQKNVQFYAMILDSIGKSFYGSYAYPYFVYLALTLSLLGLMLRYWLLDVCVSVWLLSMIGKSPFEGLAPCEYPKWIVLQAQIAQNGIWNSGFFKKTFYVSSGSGRVQFGDQDIKDAQKAAAIIRDKKNEQIEAHRAAKAAKYGTVL